MSRTNRTNKPATTFVTLSCAALLALASCGGEEGPGAGPGGVQILPSTQSACKSNAPSERGAYSLGGLSATAQGDTVTILRSDAHYNCASKLALDVTVTGGQIEVKERITNPGELAFCMCDYDLSVQVKGLAAGSYQVSLLDSDGKPAGQAQVTVAAPAALQIQSQQSACKGSAQTFSGGKLSATVAGGTVKVLHEDASYNCAAKVALEASVSGNTILVTEVITNPADPMARCMCEYDLTGEINGLAAGSYTLEVRDAEGKTVGTLQIAL